MAPQSKPRPAKFQQSAPEALGMTLITQSFHDDTTKINFRTTKESSLQKVVFRERSHTIHFPAEASDCKSPRSTRVSPMASQKKLVRRSSLGSPTSNQAIRLARESSLQVTKPTSEVSVQSLRERQLPIHGLQLPVDDYYDGPMPPGTGKHGIGLHIFANGDSYFGDFHNNLMHGNGTFRWYDSTYSGKWVEGAIQGTGKLSTPENDYDGPFEGGVPHGKGKLSCNESRAVYKGDFKKGAATGKGEIKYEDGSVYKGDVRHGLPHGKGKFNWSDGQIYDGEVFNGKLDGWGVLQVLDENMKFIRKYEGQFLEGKKHGYGHEIDPQANSEYQGKYEHDKKHGKGICYMNNGAYYEGHFKFDKFDGKGVLCFSQGGRYEGHFKNGLFHGKGKLVDHDGAGGIEIGTFREGFVSSAVRWENDRATDPFLLEPIAADVDSQFVKKEQIPMEAALAQLKMKRAPQDR